MAKIYPVMLEPLKALNSGLEKITSTGKQCFAIISDEDILFREDTPLELGRVYKQSYKTKQDSNRKSDFLAYICPYKLVNTPEGTFRVKELGSLHVKGFEKGMLEERGMLEELSK